MAPEAKKTWKGIRCRYCGARLSDGTTKNTDNRIVAKGKCPVNKKDCGRP